MGYLTIKDFNKEKVHIQNSKQYYSLGYKLDYTSLSSVSFVLHDVDITEDNGYYISIKDKDSIKKLEQLDEYLIENISNYKCILHRNDKYYIYLKKNDYLDFYMKHLLSDKLTINIIKLKKTASHTFPIVYVL